MAEEPVVGDLPAVGAGVAEQEPVADGGRGDGLAGVEDVAWGAQFAADAQGDLVEGGGARVGPGVGGDEGERVGVAPGGREPEVVGAAADEGEGLAVDGFEVGDLGQVGAGGGRQVPAGFDGQFDAVVVEAGQQVGQQVEVDRLAAGSAPSPPPTLT
ncbi:hypothetical protein GCM10029992_45030 [Glycomyces albus]